MPATKDVLAILEKRLEEQRAMTTQEIEIKLQLIAIEQERLAAERRTEIILKEISEQYSIVITALSLLDTIPDDIRRLLDISNRLYGAMFDGDEKPITNIRITQTQSVDIEIFNENDLLNKIEAIGADNIDALSALKVVPALMQIVTTAVSVASPIGAAAMTTGVLLSQFYKLKRGKK